MFEAYLLVQFELGLSDVNKSAFKKLPVSIWSKNFSGANP